MKVQDIYPNLLPIKKWRVKSRSHKDIFYNVELYKDGQLKCECPAGCFKRPCRHKLEVMDKINAEKPIPKEPF